MNTSRPFAIAAAFLFSHAAIGEDQSIGHAHEFLRKQWDRVQTEFTMLKLIDSGDSAQAMQQFQAVRIAHGAIDIEIMRAYQAGDTNKLRMWLSLEINSWIIQEAGHSQTPALTVLLDNQDRLQFLKELSSYRKSHANLPADASDQLVADVLQAAAKKRIPSQKEDQQSLSPVLVKRSTQAAHAPVAPADPPHWHGVK